MKRNEREEEHFFVSDGISGGKAWATYTQKPNGALRRVVSKYLPVRASRDQAERDLRIWLNESRNVRTAARLVSVEDGGQGGTETITDAQARTLRILIFEAKQCGPIEDCYIWPDEIFSRRDNIDNGHRRNWRRLKDMGFLQPSSQLGQYRFLFYRAQEAWEKWYKKRGFRFGEEKIYGP
jgi:hypothetical protein